MDRHRTNIELDATAVETIMRRYGVRTKTEAVDLALRHLAGRPLSAREALALRGARLIEELPDDARPGDARPGDARPDDAGADDAPPTGTPPAP